MSHRAQYLLLAATCLLNSLAMFYVAFGAAFGGPQRYLLWPAIGLMIGGILILAAISGARATQIGRSSVLTFVAVCLTIWLFPLVLIVIGYLALKPEVQPGIRPVRVRDAWLQPVVLLVLPWIVLFAIGMFAHE
jgi:hypothetical protein